jgi:hypothetical protein
MSRPPEKISTAILSDESFKDLFGKLEGEEHRKFQKGMELFKKKDNT